MDVRTDLGARGIGGCQCTGFGRAVGIARPDTVAIRRAVRVRRAIRIAGPLGISRAIRVRGAVRVGGAVLKASDPTPTDRLPMEDDLVASGRFVRIDTRGRQTGHARAVTIGFVEDDATPGALLVAAGSADAAWAQNLLAEPACHVTVGDRSFDAIAEPLDPAEHARAIRELILRYGTPAEGLGHGTSFRLRPVGLAAG